MLRSSTYKNLRRRAYTLIAVLIVVTVLSLAAYRFADGMTSEYSVAVRTSEAAQARSFAVSGVHYAAAALADPNTFSGTLANNPYDNPSFFSNVTVSEEANRGGGRFSLISAGDTYQVGGGESRFTTRYGVIDEGAKLNINAMIALDNTGQALHDALMKLPNMTEDIADAIVDWVDSDDTARTAGAESSYYSGLNPPYLAKNGPLSSLDELLLVRGVTVSLLYGNDRNRNGRLDPGEEDGMDFSRGWSEYLTCYGRELDADSEGNPRLNLNNIEDVNTFVQDLTARVGQEMADYIIYAKMGGTVSQLSTTNTTTSTNTSSSSGNNSSGSSSSGGNSSSGSGSSSSTSRSGSTGTMTMTAATSRSGTTSSSSSGSSSSGTVLGTPDMLHAAVTQMLSQGKAPTKQVKTVFTYFNSQATLPQQPAVNGQTPPTIVVPSPLNDPTKRKELLPKLLDLTTTRTTYEIVPRVNVNTAPPEVLLALPGLTQADVDAIVAARSNLDPTDPATTTGSWIVTEANVNPTTFQSIEKYVTGRTMTYRAHSIGYFGKSGPIARVEAVIDTNQGHPRFLYFRDLTDLGRGFDLPR